MQAISLTDTLSVAAQPELADLAELAAAGFTHVVCNRPDGETPGQPDMDSMAAAAEAAGLAFTRYPVDAGSFPGGDLGALGTIFDSEEKVLAYCRTGTRCANLWVASRSDDQLEAAARHAQGLGFDLSLAARARSGS